ncbi:MAG: hypothetical protein P1V51_16670 [Deltaproteobacteria bacterium]|nr:hypothetical protein [Deltaproteobacteria bacterium]
MTGLQHDPHHRRRGLALGLLLLLGLGACIIRPESTEAARRDFDRAALGDVILRAVPPGANPSQPSFDDGVKLAGWRTEPERPRAGDRVTVEFYWEVLEEPQDDWRVFVHLEPIAVEGGRINGDHDPAGGRYPTRVWRTGEVVADRWAFTIPGYLQTSGIEIWTGMYQGGTRQGLVPRSGVRNDGQNRAMIGVIPLAAE